MNMVSALKKSDSELKLYRGIIIQERQTHVVSSWFYETSISILTGICKLKGPFCLHINSLVFLFASKCEKQAEYLPNGLT